MIFGFAGDTLGLTPTLVLVAGAALVTLPLAYRLRPAFAAERRP